MIGWTNATGNMKSFDAIVMTYAIAGVGTYTIRGGKVYLNGAEVSSNLPFAIFTAGNMKEFWEIFFYRSGIANFQVFPSPSIDVFCCGGGGGAANYNAWCGMGGGGGYTQTKRGVGISLNTNYNVVIGAGGAAGDRSGGCV